MQKANGVFQYGADMVLVMASNPDLTMPSPSRIVGGIGPFDFSGAANTSSVPFSVKIDTAAAETVNIDVSAGCVDITAVTVAELVILLNAAGFTDMSFDTEVVTLRLLCEYIGTLTTPNYMQIYGECARLAGIGQGLGCQFVKIDGMQSVNEVPKIKAAESVAVEDAQGDETSIEVPEKRKGVTGNLVDTVKDTYLRAIIEGGTYNFTTGSYTVPLATADKIYFYMEFFVPEYGQGENAESNITSYGQTIIKLCLGGVGDVMHNKGFVVTTYPYTGYHYTDSAGTRSGDTEKNDLTEGEYLALDVANL